MNNFIKINYKGTELNLRNAVEKEDNAYYIEIRNTVEIWNQIHNSSHEDVQKMNLSLKEVTDLFNTYMVDNNIYKMYLRFIRKEEMGEKSLMYSLKEELKNGIRYWGNRKGSVKKSTIDTANTDTNTIDIVVEEILEDIEDGDTQILLLSPAKEIPIQKSKSRKGKKVSV